MRKTILLALFSLLVTRSGLYGQAATICPVSEPNSWGQTQYYFEASFYFPFTGQPVINWSVTNGTIIQQNTNPSVGPVSVKIAPINSSTIFIVNVSAKDANGMVQDGSFKSFPFFVEPESWIKPFGFSTWNSQQLCTFWGNLTASGNSYQWQEQVTDITVEVPDEYNWTDIWGETNSTYTPITSGLSSKRWFRRVTTTSQQVYYSTASVLIPGVFTAGIIAAETTVIPYNSIPIITAKYAGGGEYAPSSLTYRWEKSTSNGIWTTIGGNTAYYPNLPITGTTKIRRAVSNRSGATFYSNELIFTTTYVSPNHENLNYIRENTILKSGVENWEGADMLPIGEKVQSTTYLDGLGRPLQTVDKEVSSALNGIWKDRVKHYEYDAAGRTTKNFLPYATSEFPGKYKPNASSAQDAYIKNFFNEPSTAATYSKVEYDESPLNKIIKSMSPGQSWAGNNIGTTSAIDYNRNAENVHLWTLDYSLSAIPITSVNQKYAEGTLLKQISVDEKQNQVVTYKDISGNIVLRKTQEAPIPSLSQDHQGWVCTYYVYDDFGLLRYVITPKAVKYLDEQGWNLTQGIVDELCFRYDYDEKGRVILKKQPGAGEQVVVYDKKDRPILTQDANQKAKGQWAFTLYDELSRSVATGLFDNIADRIVMQNYVNSHLNNGVVSLSVFVGNGIYQSLLADNPIAGSTGSSNYCNGCNASTLTFNSITHYDNYNYSGVKAFIAPAPIDDLPANPYYSSRTTGFVTGEKIRVLDNDNNPLNDKFLFSSAYINESGLSLQNLADNIKINGVDNQTNHYDFAGRVISSTLRHNNGSSTFSVITTNVFDKVGRVTGLFKNFNGTFNKQLAAYTYDELGQLKTKRLAPGYTATGKSEMESFTYDYNIQGWLTGINKEYALSDNNYSQWDKYFGMYLGYDNRDAKFTEAQYNGNLTGIIWKSQGDNSPRKYNYTYDRLDRFTSALFMQKKKPTDGWLNTEVDFSTYMEYEDGNGNIKSMKHYGVVPGINSGIVIDDMLYDYKTISGVAGLRGNKLAKVGDANSSLGSNNGFLGDFKDGPNSGDDYEYDDNGNLIKDLNKNIVNGSQDGVVYNFLNKPDKIVIPGKSVIEFTYDVSGAKLKKKITYADNSVRSTTYIGDFVYEQFTPAGGSSSPDELKYVLHDEGRLKIITPHNQVNTIDYELNAGSFGVTWPGGKQGVFEYFVKDHLASTRMVLTEEVQKEFYKATMELSAQSLESPLFGTVDNLGQPTSANEWIRTRMDNSPWPGNNSGVAKLTASDPSRKIGPNMILKVMAGDVISTSTSYFYYNNNSSGGGSPVNSLLSSLVGSLSSPKVGPIGHANAGLVNSSLTNNVPLNDFINNQPNYGNPNAPKAYLNIIFLDEQFKFIDKDIVTPNVGSDFTRVSQANTPNALLWLEKKAPKNGWVFVYLSNESDENVYFDNFAVTQEHSRIAEENHYYAYGLKISGISSKAFNKLQNSYGHQGEFSEEEVETGWNEFDLRMYNPQIGRWNNIDPYDQFESPYLGLGNNPVNSIDPDGGWDWLLNEKTGQYEYFDNINSAWEFLASGLASQGYSYDFKNAKGGFTGFFAGDYSYFTSDGVIGKLVPLEGVTLENKGKSGWEKKWINVSSISANKWEYESGEAWYKKGFKFIGNTIVSAYNGAVGTVDAVLNLHVTANNIRHTVIDAADYLTTHSAGEMLSDLKTFATEKLTDPHFYEDLLASGLTLKYIGNASSKISGRTQTWGTKTPGHGFRQNLEAWKHALDPRVSKVTMSQNWNTLSGLNAPKKGNWFPDIGVKFKNGSFKTIEVKSRTDNAKWLQNKHEIFMRKNNLQGKSSVVKPFGIFKL